MAGLYALQNYATLIGSAVGRVETAIGSIPQAAAHGDTSRLGGAKLPLVILAALIAGGAIGYAAAAPGPTLGALLDGLRETPRILYFQLAATAGLVMLCRGRRLDLASFLTALGLLAAGLWPLLAALI